MRRLRGGPHQLCTNTEAAVAVTTAVNLYNESIHSTFALVYSELIIETAC